MSNLKKFQLTDKVKGLTFINLSKNGPDPNMRFKVATLTDQQAARLLTRKDGRGAQYVQPIAVKPPAPPKK